MVGNHILWKIARRLYRYPEVIMSSKSLYWTLSLSLASFFKILRLKNVVGKGFLWIWPADSTDILVVKSMLKSSNPLNFSDKCHIHRIQDPWLKKAYDMGIMNFVKIVFFFLSLTISEIKEIFYRNI